MALNEEMEAMFQDFKIVLSKAASMSFLDETRLKRLRDFEMKLEMYGEWTSKRIEEYRVAKSSAEAQVTDLRNGSNKAKDAFNKTIQYHCVATGLAIGVAIATIILCW